MSSVNVSCPVQGCPRTYQLKFNGEHSKPYIKHLQSHLNQGDSIPADLCSKFNLESAPSSPSQVSDLQDQDQVQEQDLLPSLEEIIKKKVPILKSVPKQLKRAFAEILSSVLNSAAFNNDEHSIKLLLLLPRCTLWTSSRKRSQSLINSLKVRFEKWKEKKYLELWNSIPPTPVSSFKSFDINYKVESLVKYGNFTSAMRSLTSSPIAPFNDETLDILKKKHPVGPNTPFSQLSPSKPVDLTELEVLKALKSFRRGTAAGPCCLHVAYFLDSVDIPGSSLLTNLTHFVNNLVNGKLPESSRSVFTAANLTALTKKDGGIRPIAVGSVLRRLVSKCMMFRFNSKISTFLSPFQVGVGTPGGAEAIPHALRSMFNQDPSLLLLKIDFENAFNLINRDIFINTVREHFPEMYNWVSWCYCSSSNLYYSNNIINSSLGVQQGDPLGPFLFCLVLRRLILSIKDQSDIDIQMWYLDDGCLVGDEKSLLKALDIIKTCGPQLGLNVNLDKCEICSFEDQDLSKFTLVQKRIGGFDILGVAIGPADFTVTFVQNKITKIKALLDSVSSLRSSQTSLLLLRNCLSFCRLNFILRTTPPDFISKLLADFDLNVRSCFENIISVVLNDRSWSQCILPVRLGGFGLRSTAQHCSSAFISSVSSSISLVNRLCNKSLTFEDFSTSDSVLSLQTNFNIAPPYIRSQKSISKLIDQYLFDSYFNSSSDIDKARLLSITQPNAASWVNALPIPSLKLTNPQISTIVRYWVGGTIFEENLVCSKCAKELDTFGHHCFLCRSPDRVTRHNIIRDWLYNLCQQALLRPILEKANLFDSKARPADVYLPCFFSGRGLAIDVSVYTPVQASLVPTSSSQPLAAAASAELQKRKKYVKDCETKGIDFIPFVLETYGAFGKEALCFLKKITRIISNRSSLSFVSVFSDSIRSLSVALQRHNSLCILKRQLIV